MILSNAIKQYVTMKRAAGLKYAHEECMLKNFVTFVGDQPLKNVTEDTIIEYLHRGEANNQQIERKYFLLRQFFRWCIERNYLNFAPIRYKIKITPSEFVPYIYSHDEISKILLEALNCSCTSSPLLGETIRALLLTIYSCGLRLGEAISLRICDVDFQKKQLYIIESKFRKSRILPFCDQLACFLSAFLRKRQYQLPLISQEQSPLFCSRTGNKLYGPYVDHIFQRIRKNCNIEIQNRKIQPRIHDLRHSFAVHRLCDWYKKDLPVKELLPALSTYLGHKDIEDTKTYLTLTPELLQFISEKFEKHTFEE